MVSIDPVHMAAISALDEGVAPPGPTPVRVARSDEDRRRAGTPAHLRPKVGKWLLVAADVLTVAATATALQVAGLTPGTTRAGDRLLVVTLVVAWVAFLFAQRMHKHRFVQLPGQELRRLCTVALGAGLTVVSVAYLTELAPSRAWLAVSVLSLLAAMSVERSAARALFHRLRSQGALVRRVVLAGDADDVASVLGGRDELRRDGYEVVEAVHLDAPGGTAPERRVLDAVIAGGAGGILLTGTGVRPDVVRRLSRIAHEAGVHVELLSPLHDVAANRITVHAIGSASVLYLEQVDRSGWRRVAKRGFDLATAWVVLVLCAPLFVVVAIAIKLDSAGPVLYRQTRVGRDFAPFEILKFRSMVVDAEALRAELEDRNEADGPLFKLADDPRVTRVGAFLRKTSIDELPQLWNVVRGEMSMVGPRPATPDEVRSWPEELAWRVRVTPGITGMWQVHGRSLASFEDYSRLDLYYVDNWSLATDLALLAKTVPVVLLRRGAW